MQLKKITDRGKTGDLVIGQSEILIVDWSKGSKPDLFAFDKSLDVISITEEYFAQSSVGNQYKKIESQLGMPLYHFNSTKGKNGEIYLCNYQQGIVFGFNKDGNKIFEWVVNIGEGHSVYDIKFQAPDFLWLAFPSGHTISQISISEKKEVFKVGKYSWDDETDPLNYPESIFVKNHFIFIPNMGSKKLLKLNSLTKAMTLIETFEEAIWQYAETEIGNFVVTDSGLYEILI